MSVSTDSRFTVNATYSEAGPFTVQTQVSGGQSLRDAAESSGKVLMEPLKTLGLNVTLDIDATDICGSECVLYCPHVSLLELDGSIHDTPPATVGMAGPRSLQGMLSPSQPVSFVFHPRYSTPVSDIIREKVRNELIAGTWFKSFAMYPTRK